MIVLLIGSMVYALAISNVINVIVNMARESNDYIKTMHDVNMFMETHHLQRSLRILVRQFFAQAHRYSTSVRAAQEEFLLRKMSPELRGLCARQMNEKWLADVPFLASLNNTLLAELFMTLRLQVFIPREYIFTEDDTADRMYIIRRGAVFVRGKLFTQNKAFGEEMTFSKQGRRGYSAQTLQFVETYVLLRTDFLDLMNGHPELLKQIRRDALKMTFGRAAVGTLRRLARQGEGGGAQSIDSSAGFDAEVAFPFADVECLDELLEDSPTPSPVHSSPVSGGENENASMSANLNVELNGVVAMLQTMQDSMTSLAQEVADLRKMVRENRSEGISASS